MNRVQLRPGRRVLLWLWAAAIVLAPRESGAQERAVGALRGTVTDSTGQAIAGAAIRVAGLAAESDAQGRFALPRVDVGTHLVEARRLGYRPTISEVVITAAAEATLTLRMQGIPSQLTPVVVRGRQAIRGPLAGFYARMERGEGRFVTGEQIQQRQLFTMRDILRNVPGAQVRTVRGRSTVRFRGSSASPIVIIDGVRTEAAEMDVGNLDPRSFAGIEIYTSAATAPAEFAVSRLSGQAGGVMVIWTKEGSPLPRRRRRGAETPAAITQSLVASGEAFTEDQVDVPARPSSELPFAPIYPDSLFGSQQAGFVLAEFVVIRDGQVRAETINIVTASHPLFAESVRSALITASFVPARRGGVPVEQVVQLPIRFVPVEPGARPRGR